MFTPVIFLASVNLFYTDSGPLKLLYTGLIYFAILTHNSNLVIAFLFFASLFLVSVLSPAYQKVRRKAMSLVIVTLCSWLTLCSIHFISGNGFKPSKSSHIFLIAKLSENGILKAYLTEHCHQEEFKLCAYKDNLPSHAWDFIWNDNGAFAHSGYWDSSSAEYTKIIKGTLTEPKFLWMNIKESINATFVQFIKTDIGDGLTPQIDGSNPYWKIQAQYGRELNLYLKSKQNRGTLNFSFLNHLYFYTFILGFVIFLVLILLRKIKPHFIPLFAAVVFFCLLNAFTTASLANILARLNSRCIWLIPFIVLIAFTDAFFIKDKKIPTLLKTPSIK